MRQRYGAGPLHLLALVGCFALAGAAVLALSESPAAVRIGLWALGAVVLHDLVLFPLYALADRGLVAAVRDPRDVNWVRVPALLSGLLLLLFWPAVTQHGEPAFARASGLDLDGYLVRYLAVVAALFLGSGLLFALSRRRRRA